VRAIPDDGSTLRPIDRTTSYLGVYYNAGPDVSEVLGPAAADQLRIDERDGRVEVPVPTRKPAMTGHRRVSRSPRSARAARGVEGGAARVRRCAPPAWKREPGDPAGDAGATAAGLSAAAHQTRAAASDTLNKAAPPDSLHKHPKHGPSPSRPSLRSRPARATADARIRGAPRGAWSDRAPQVARARAGLRRRWRGALDALAAREHYEAWLAAGRHGEMSWLASSKHRERRAEPERLVENLRAVLCVALCHPPGRDPARDQRLGRIARYAAGEDYHRIMKEKLLTLERWIQRELFPGSGSLWYSDTGAILERGWAERAGLGWVGKHAGLLSDRWARGSCSARCSWTASWFPTRRSPERCGTCVRCIDACPTRAIVAPYQVDARLCISYLTIELKGPIPRELRPLVGDWIFGCDLCQEACPWNRFAPPAREARLHARELEGWSLERFLALDEQGFLALFATSPIRRADRAGFVRNVCVAMGNRGEPGFAAPLARALRDDRDALVRGHAAWALGRVAAAAPGADAMRGEASAALDTAAHAQGVWRAA
jgi:epoxyqueuosine reductase